MYRYFCTYLLILVNVIVFFLVRSGKLDVEDLGLSYHMVFNRGQYHRLVTSAFTHKELMHFFFNMVSLYNIGTFVEYAFGHLYMLVIYFASMIFGHLLALMIRHSNHDDYTMSIGASGAICGIMGTYFLVVMYFYGFSGIYDLARPIINLILISALPGVDGTSHFSCMAVGMAVSYIILKFLW